MLTTETINSFWERSGGFGYLGQRNREGIDKVFIADEVLLEVANKQGWTEEELFEFCDSRYGRYYADFAFDGHPDAYEIRMGQARWALIRKVEEN
jgi:hypothetical protein